MTNVRNEILGIKFFVYMHGSIYTGCLKKRYTLQSVIFLSILEIQQNQIYHCIRNYMVYLHV